MLRQKKKMSFDVTIPEEPSAGRTSPFMFHHEIEAPEIGVQSQDFVIGSGGPTAVPLPPPPPGARQGVIYVDEPA